MPALLAVLTALLQVGYPLTSGTARDGLTVAIVLALAAATVAHASATRGAAWASSYLGLVLVLTVLVEAVGVATGLPFGDYRYGGGPAVLDVPVLVPVAWVGFVYPCLLLAQRCGLVWGVVALVGWDVFLDPQLVADGRWTWLDVQHHLPGVPTVPLSNLGGWLLVSTVLLGLLRLLPRRGDDLLPKAWLTWVLASSVLANVAFLHRPWVALWGALVLTPPVVRWWRA